MDGAWRRPTDSRLCSGTPSLREVPSGGARALCLLSRFSKVSRRQGGTLSGRYLNNGYVPGPTVLTVRPSSQASQLPHLDRGVSDRDALAGGPSSQASQLPHLDRGVSDRDALAGGPSSQASQLPHLDRGVSDRDALAGGPSSQASQLPHLDRGASARSASAISPSREQAPSPQYGFRRQASSHTAQIEAQTGRHIHISFRSSRRPK